MATFNFGAASALLAGTVSPPNLLRGSPLAGIPNLLGKASLGALSLGDAQGLLRSATSGNLSSLLNGSIMNVDAPGVSKAATHVYPWGIYQDGEVVVKADSVVSVEYRHEWHVSDFPQEAGAFASYNKVAMPFDARVTLSKGGTAAERSYFLANIETVAASLELYEVWTPERTYLNTNIARVDYRRTARAGAGLVTVDLWLVEIRATATATLSKTKSKSGADTVSLGVVQAGAPTPAQIRAVGNPVAGGR